MSDRGSQLDFDTVYARHEALVRKILAQRGISPADLDDVVQETFVTVHRALPKFEGRASIETWLHAVAWRVASGHHRRRRAQRNVPDDASDVSIHPATLDLPGAERLHASLDRLDPDERDLFALHEIGGMSISELAEITGSSRATISERLDRSRRVLGRYISAPPPAVRAPALIETPAALVPASRETPPLEYECADCCLARIGDLVIARWRGETRFEALDLVGKMALAAAEQAPLGVTYLSVIEATSQPPDRAGREVFGRYATLLGSRLRAVSTAIDKRGLGYLAVPFINAYLFLSRQPLNIRYFHELPEAVSWAAPYVQALTEQEISQRCDEMKVRLDRYGA